jgi:hypothetical protein
VFVGHFTPDGHVKPCCESFRTLAWQKLAMSSNAVVPTSLRRGSTTKCAWPASLFLSWHLLYSLHVKLFHHTVVRMIHGAFLSGTAASLGLPRFTVVRAEQRQPAESTIADTKPQQPDSRTDEAGNGAAVSQPPAPARQWPEERSFGEVALSKLGDTAQDIWVIANRSLLPLPTREKFRARQGGEITRPAAEAEKPVLLILGFGWGAHRCFVGCLYAVGKT